MSISFSGQVPSAQFGSRHTKKLTPDNALEKLENAHFVGRKVEVIVDGNIKTQENFSYTSKKNGTIAKTTLPSLAKGQTHLSKHASFNINEALKTVTRYKKGH